MKNKYSYYCILHGDKVPVAKITNSNLSHYVSNFNIIGDVGKIGRYKDKIYDFNSITLSAQSENMIDFLNLFKSNYLLSSSVNVAEYKEFHLYMEYENQCNLEFSSEEINLINSLQLNLTISCERN